MDCNTSFWSLKNCYFASRGGVTLHFTAGCHFKKTHATSEVPFITSYLLFNALVCSRKLFPFATFSIFLSSFSFCSRSIWSRKKTARKLTSMWTCYMSEKVWGSLWCASLREWWKCRALASMLVWQTLSCVSRLLQGKVSTVQCFSFRVLLCLNGHLPKEGKWVSH